MTLRRFIALTLAALALAWLLLGHPLAAAYWSLWSYWWYTWVQPVYPEEEEW